MLFFCDFSRFFRNFAKILPEFLEISRKSIKFANFYEFQGVPDKTRTQIRQETQRRPIVLPLRGAEVLVAVRGPSPGEGGREKSRRKNVDCRMRRNLDPDPPVGRITSRACPSCNSRFFASFGFFTWVANKDFGELELRTSPNFRTSFFF